MKRILTVLAVLVAVFATGMLVFTDHNGGWSVPFPGKTKVRVIAPPASTLEDIRYVTYPSKDSTIPEEEQIEYKSGVTGYIYYRSNGTIRETTEFWPAPEGSTQRQLKSGSVRTDDGTGFLSDKSFRADGTREREGQRLVDGTYQIDFYFADGARLAKHQLISADGKPLLEQVYRDNGSMQSVLEVDSTGKKTITTYFADGKTESVTTVPSNYWEDVTAVYYFPDGVTVARQIDWTSYSTNVDYYRQDGTKRLSSAETHYSGGSFTWVHYDAKGKPVFKQSYRVDTKVDAATGKTVTTYLLREVDELNADGKVTREIDFASDGVTPNQVFIPKPAGSYWAGTRKTFRADGTVEKVEEKNGNGDVVSTKTYTAQDNVRENVPASTLVRPVEADLPIPPKKTAVTPPPYYYGFP